MKTALFAAALAASAVAASAGTASAADLRLTGLIAEVRIIPEARADFEARVVRGHSELPRIQLRQTSGGLTVDGGLGDRVQDCGGIGRGVKVRNGPSVSKRELPIVEIRAPRDLTVVADGYVRGQAGALQTLSLTQRRCGDWTVGDVSRALTVRVEGMGDVAAGRVGDLDVRLEGMGDVEVASVSGRVRAELEGMGDVKIAGGRASAMTASVDGMGDVEFGGTAATLDASVDGLGSVKVAEVTGEVKRSVSGLGRVRVGR